jgi:large subunit ribosomal protein L4
MAAIKVKIYNQDGTDAGEKELDAKIFGVKSNPKLIHEMIVAQETNSRETISRTKDRGEVKGGGKKPWKQKHTGRARHGSTRSPIWKGGGVVFGPRQGRVWSVKVNKKAKKQALKMVISDKLSEGKLVILASLDLAEYKTKAVAKMLKNLPVSDKKTLIALPVVPATIWKSCANIPSVTVSKTDSLNIVDLLKNRFLVLTVKGVEELTKKLS